MLGLGVSIGDITMNTLGQLIGKVVQNFSIKGDAGWSTQGSITIDFTTCTDAEIKSWLASNRVIAGQRPWRSLSSAEFSETINGKVFLAQNIGQKVKSRSEQVAVYTNMGLPTALAEMAVDDPGKFKEAMDSIE